MHCSCSQILFDMLVWIKKKVVRPITASVDVFQYCTTILCVIRGSLARSPDNGNNSDTCECWPGYRWNSVPDIWSANTAMLYSVQATYPSSVLEPVQRSYRNILQLLARQLIALRTKSPANFRKSSQNIWPAEYSANLSWVSVMHFARKTTV